MQTESPTFSLVAPSEEPRRCSFCDTRIAEDDALAAAEGTAHRICRECIALCGEVLEQAGGRPQGSWDVSCSFCGAHQRDVKMVAAPRLYICDRCVTSVARAVAAR